MLAYWCRVYCPQYHIKAIIACRWSLFLFWPFPQCCSPYPSPACMWHIYVYYLIKRVSMLQTINRTTKIYHVIVPRCFAWLMPIYHYHVGYSSIYIIICIKFIRIYSTVCNSHSLQSGLKCTHLYGGRSFLVKECNDVCTH